MIFNDIPSFFYIILFILLYNIVNSFSTKQIYNNLILLLGSIIVLKSITSIGSLALISGVCIIVYYSGIFLSKTNIKHKRTILYLLNISLILLFSIKNYKLVELDILSRIGLSYILFRLIHFLIESSKKQINSYSLLSFINYVIFFPSFISGPIDDYNNFSYWLSNKRKFYRYDLIKIGLFKLSIGIVKKFLIVPAILIFAQDFSFFNSYDIWQEGFVISLFFYSFYILFDFSGYSDIAIGTAYLIGIKTPENFDNPYFASNLSVFWKKWHMTFSNFLFQYVFKPFVVKLSNIVKAPRLLISSIGYIFTFTLCGLWHGTTINFIYWGLWHGIGLIILKIWQSYSPIKYKLTISKYLSILFTFNFVTFGWFFFSYKTSDIKLIINNITHYQDTFKVSNVVYKGKPRIKLTIKNPRIDSIDIMYNINSKHLNRVFYNIKIDSLKNIFISPDSLGKHLAEIKIRTINNKKRGKWERTLKYIYFNEFELNNIQQIMLTPKNEIVNESNKPFLILNTALYINKEIENQIINPYLTFINGYGWAIQIDYSPSPIHKVRVDYKFENEEWKNYVPNRDGQYNFLHIHGNETINQLNRNVKKGNYKFRLHYYNEAKKSHYFYSSLKVKKYEND